MRDLLNSYSYLDLAYDEKNQMNTREPKKGIADILDNIYQQYRRFTGELAPTKTVRNDAKKNLTVL